MDRMSLPILPALIVLAAYLTSRLVVSSPRPRWINSWLPIIFVVLTTGIPFAKHLEGARLKELAETKAMDIVAQEVRQDPAEEILLICSDSRSPRSLAFHFGYHYPDNLRVVYFGDLSDESQLPSYTLLFRDRGRSAFLNRAYGFVHYDAELDELDRETLYESGNVTLEKLVKREQLRRLIEPNKRMESHN
jgi:hypothetical protein